MNRNNVIRNVCAITLFLLSIAETIVMGKCASFKWYHLALYQVMICVGICCIRFSYFFAQLQLYSSMHKWGNSDDFDDEPSEYGIFMVKILGCFFLFFPVFVYASFS